MPEHDHDGSLTDAADAELYAALSALMGSYADRGICGGCLLRLAVTHLLGFAHANYGADLARDILVIGSNILEDVEAETEPPGLH